MEEKELTPIEEIRERQLKPVNIFDAKKENNVPAVTTDKKAELVDNMFEQAVVHEVANNEELKTKVLDTARKYTDTKMQVIGTNVDTENKEANFNNKRDACESYGFSEKTTPIWATNFMKMGYDIMLSIWLFIGTFTFMPVIFITRKLSVGLKKGWVAVLFALTIYLGVVFIPIILSLIKR